MNNVKGKNNARRKIKYRFFAQLSLRLQYRDSVELLTNFLNV